MQYIIREISPSEYPLLADFLYEAIFIPEGVMPPPKSIIASDELQIYIKRFGTLPDDKGYVAVIDQKIVGAVWVRIMDDYGHIDAQTPSFAISIYPDYRGLGIGTALMQEMLAWLKSSGYERASLAVQKTNYAVKLYKKMGFQVINETSEEYIMLCSLSL